MQSVLNQTPLATFMRETYNMDFVGKAGVEFIFNRDNRQYRYTRAELKNFDAPIESNSTPHGHFTRRASTKHGTKLKRG